MSDPLKEAIEGTKACTVLQVEWQDRSLRVVHRVKGSKLRVWLAVLRYVMYKSRRAGTGLRFHACKHYFLSDEAELLYTWTFNVQSDSPIADHQQFLTRAILEASSKLPSRGVRLESYPLDAGPDRNAPEGPINPRATGYRQKGAQPVKG